MTLVQIYLVLYNKKKYLLFFFLFILFFFQSIKATAEKITPIIIINKSIISNIDLSYEIELLETENNNLNSNILKQIAYKNLIEFKIKELEIKKSNIKLKQDYLEKELNLINSSIDKKFEDLSKRKKIKELIKKKIKINMEWSILIKKLYFSDININVQEINDISKKNNLDKIEKNKLILSEQNKKIKKFSKSHYNKIKRNYIIKYYEE